MVKIALGTAQFGLTYGVANRTGKVDLEEVSQILTLAKQSGVDTLDTAIAYGDAESMLGRIGCSTWNVISKLPPIPPGIADVSAWVQSEVRRSLDRLKITTLHGLLLHQPSDLLGVHAKDLIGSLLNLKSQGLVSKLGVSIYSSNDLDELIALPVIDLVQAPMNIVDRGIENSGWLAKLGHRAVEVHTRSVFLQGVLVMSPDERPRWLSMWSEIFNAWDAWISDSGMSRVEACLAHVRSYPEIDRIVIGVDSADQIRQILEALEVPPLRAPITLESDDQGLINPSLWVTT